MSKKNERLYRIRIVCSTATVERVYEVEAVSQEDAIEKYRTDKGNCVEEEVTDWNDDSFDPEEPDIEEVVI